MPRHRSGDHFEPPDPLRPSRPIGTRCMTRVQQHAFRCGERHTQHHRRPARTGLPDIACDRFGLRRLVLNTEPMWCRGDVERQNALLWFWPDVGATHVADGECRAIDQFAVEVKLENQGVTARATTEPMPDELLSRRRRSLARYRTGYHRQCTDRCNEGSRTPSGTKRAHFVSDARPRDIVSHNLRTR